MARFASSSGKDPRPRGMRLTPRDLEVCKFVYDVRHCLRAHIEQVAFADTATGEGHQPSASVCIHRLALLVEHGFLCQ